MNDVFSNSFPTCSRFPSLYQFQIEQSGNIGKVLDVNLDGSVTLAHFNETLLSQTFFYSAQSKRIISAKYFKALDISDESRIILSAPDLASELQEFGMSNDGEIFSLQHFTMVIDVNENSDILVAEKDPKRKEQKWRLVYGSDMTLLVGTNDGTIAAKFTGSYGSENGDGTFTQDHNIGLENDNIHVQSNNQVTLVGNAWKAFRLEPSYNIRRDTILRFSFSVEEEAEGHAICLEDDLSEDTFSGRSRRCIALSGTQIDKWNYVFRGNQYSTDGDAITRTYDVPVGRIFDNVFKVKYIAFIQDNDLQPDKGNSSFASITLTDDYNGPEVCFVK